ncbi:MAG TPA: glycosyltransferase family 4 protein [Planctomycetota bacterium]|nr:glycosyltransferase family 4 protein [Planctomycetota bacterium]HRR78860.1 glycosyltransferase family 4 protein [Planctomycetota bacterium]
MNVLVVASLYPHAQNETIGLSTHRRTVELAKTCSVKVVALTTRGDLPESDSYEGVDVLRPRWHRLPKLGVLLDGYRYAERVGRVVARQLPDFDFDVIDAHWLYPDGFAAVRLGQRLRKPVVVTGRGSDVDEFLRRWPVRSFARRALRGATRLVALSRAHKHKMIEAGPRAESISVIPNGVDTALFRPGNPEAARHALGLVPEGLVLFSAGSLVADKGFQHLITGVARLRRPASLYIAGPGDYRAALERLARDLGVADRVTFLGRVSQQQMPLWYQAADFFCFGSYHEGCPNAILEALACGTPVVSTDVGAIPDLVEEERNGVLFPPGSAEAFVAALERALAQPWDRSAIAAAGSRRSWRHAAEEYRAVFEQAVADGEALCSAAGSRGRQ